MYYFPQIGVTKLLGNVWKNIDDGSNTTFFNWGPEEPSNTTGYDCVAVNPSGIWMNDLCDEWFFICGFPEIDEKKLEKNLTNTQQ